MPILSSTLARDYCALVAQTALHAKSSWPGLFTQPPVKIVRFPCCARTIWMAFTISTSSIKQKARLQCQRLRGKTTFLLLFLSSISAKHTMICSGCPFPLRTSISLFAIIIRPVLPTGHNTSDLLSTVHHRRQKITARNVRALIAQPHVYVCMFN